MRRYIWLGLLLTGVCLRLVAAAGLQEQMRPLWSPASEGSVRTWLVCGEFPVPGGDHAAALANDYLQARGGEAAIRPVEGLKHRRPDGSPVAWQTHEAKSDTLAYRIPFAGQPEDDVVWYACTSVRRGKAGKAVLAVGSNASLRMWVNGVLVDDHFLPREVGYDDLFAVPLNAGENAVLLKIVQRSGAGNVWLRVLETAQAQAQELGHTRLVPMIDTGNDVPPDTLSVLTDDRRITLPTAKTPVDVEILDVAGRMLVRQTASRGSRVTFDITALPPGAYELCLRMTAPNGRPGIAYLPWYHGDAAKAARALVESAPDATDVSPDGMRHALLAEIIKNRLLDEVNAPKAALLPGVYPTLLEFAELQMRKAGEIAADQPGSFVRLAYRDDVDDSPQFCRIYLPSDYSPNNRYPLVIMLHGRSDEFPPYAQWGGNDQRHDNIATLYRAIVAYPHGRGNAWYRGLGDRDVMRCLDEITARFAVDNNRVYLMGYSMGGAGVWYVGTRHPERFAALVPVFGGYDFRFQLDEKTLAALAPKEIYRRERLSYIAQAEALLSTPVFASHGDQDNIVPVDYSRYTVRMLQRWGYNVRYQEKPGAGHGGLGNETEIYDWLFAQRRGREPKRVRVRSAELRFARAHWVQITQRANPYAFMQADVEIIAPNAIRVNTDNVLELTLSPGPALLDPALPVQVTWNNTEVRTELMADGSLRLRAKSYTPSTPLCKSPVLEGPANDLYNTPFALVIGTASPDPLMRAMCARAAQRLQQWWDERFHAPLRVFTDAEISPADQSQYSLLLIGGPDDNLIARELRDNIPLKIAPRVITIDGHPFRVRDAAVQLVYPNPRNPERYVIVRAATSARGMFFVDYVLNDVDFCIVDSRNADPGRAGGFFDAVTGRCSGAPVVAGYFNNAWKLLDANLEKRLGDVNKEFMWNAPELATASITGKSLPLAELVEKRASGGFLDMFVNRGIAGKTLKVGRRGYKTGLALVANYWLLKEPCWIEYDLTGGAWNRLCGVIGLERKQKASTAARDDNMKVEFVVTGDGIELFRSAPFTVATPPKILDIDISDINTLRLEIVSKTAGPSPAGAVNWADLRLER